MTWNSMDDKLGRQDSRDNVRTGSMTVTSGVADLIAASAGVSLGRRNYIRVKNVGAVDVSIVPASGTLAADGYIVDASGGEWFEETDAPLYIISTGADSEVRVYERASRFNYKK